MRQGLVMANWKMNGTKGTLLELAADIGNQLATLEMASGPAVVLCPPTPYMDAVSERVHKLSLPVAVGAQDVSPYDQGAYTGEVSVSMLTDLGCQYVLIGHSERRAYHHESDELLAKKFIAAANAGLTPVLCLGETLDEREQGRMQTVVGRQLNTVIDIVGEDVFANAVIAYEPVWAIGTGVAASSSDVAEAHAYLRSLLAARNAELAESLQILYGGSVKAANAADILAQDNVDGALVGGASLIANEFVAICKAAASV